MTSKEKLMFKSLQDQITDMNKLLTKHETVTTGQAKRDNKAKVYAVNQYKIYTNSKTNKKGQWNYNSTYFTNLTDAKVLFDIYKKNTKLGVKISERVAPKTYKQLKAVSPKA